MSELLFRDVCNGGFDGDVGAGYRRMPGDGVTEFYRDRGIDKRRLQLDHAKVVRQGLIEAARVRRTQQFLRTCARSAFEPAGERVGRVVQGVALCGYGSVSLFPGTLPGRPSDGVHTVNPSARFHLERQVLSSTLSRLGDRIISRQWIVASDTKGYATIESHPVR